MLLRFRWGNLGHSGTGSTSSRDRKGYCILYTVVQHMWGQETTETSSGSGAMSAQRRAPARLGASTSLLYGRAPGREGQQGNHGRCRKYILVMSNGHLETAITVHAMSETCAAGCAVQKNAISLSNRKDGAKVRGGLPRRSGKRGVLRRDKRRTSAQSSCAHASLKTHRAVVSGWEASQADRKAEAPGE